MPSDRTRQDSQRAITRMSESILPTVCCIILRDSSYMDIGSASLAYAAQQYESLGENCHDDQLTLLRSFKFTAEQWMLARHLHPDECEY
jgi:transposase